MNSTLKTPAQTTTIYLTRPQGRIGYDVAGSGPLVVLVPGMGDLRAAYRFLAPALREAGYRVACTDLRGHGDSDNTFTAYGDLETAGDILALIEELGGPAVLAGNSMGAGAAALAAALAPELVTGLVLIGPFARNGEIGATASAAASRDGTALGRDCMEGVHAQALRRPAAGRLRRVPRPRRGQPAPAGIRESVLPDHAHRSCTGAGAARRRRDTHVGPDGGIGPRLP